MNEFVVDVYRMKNTANSSVKKTTGGTILIDNDEDSYVSCSYILILSNILLID